MRIPLLLAGLPRLIGSQDDTLFNDDRARDHDDRARDHKAEPFVRKPGHQYAENYPDPLTGEPLQTYPSRPPSEFASTEGSHRAMSSREPFLRRMHRGRVPRERGSGHGTWESGSRIATSQSLMSSPAHTWYPGARWRES